LTTSTLKVAVTPGISFHRDLEDAERL